jgi:GT2 family glycosyltransferase
MISPKIFYYDEPNRIWWAGGTFSLWQGVPRHTGRNEMERGRYAAAADIQWATGCGMLLKSAALESSGLFDERIFSNGEDLDLSLRMRKLGWRIRYTPLAKLWHKEGYATRRNVGEHVRYFTAVRNNLWVIYKHASPIQKMTFWPYFLVRYVLVMVVKSLLRGDFRSAAAAIKGVFAFIRMRFDSRSLSLPRELAKTTRPTSQGDVFSPRISKDVESIVMPQPPA